MKKKYFDPEFELMRLSFEPILAGSDDEDPKATDGDDFELPDEL